MLKVLVVHPDPEMLVLMTSLLDDALEDDVVPAIARDEARAVKYCSTETQRPFQMVVANRAIAAGSQTPLNEAEDKGLEFLESLQRFGLGDVPKILITSALNPKLLRRAQEIPRCELLVMEDPSEFSDEFIKCARRALGTLADLTNDVQKHLKVVFSLNLHDEKWEYQMKGIGFTYVPQAGRLTVDAAALKALIGTSKRAANHGYPDWEEELLDVGRQLGRLLIYDNPEFHGFLVEGQTKAGGPEQNIICFAIEKSVHGVALEALTLPGHNDFWMLQVPIYRRLFSSGQLALERNYLFGGAGGPKEKFNALIIESPAEGIAEHLTDSKGGPLSLEPLGKVAAEADLVESALKQVAANVKRVGPKAAAARPLLEVVKETLAAGQWDLVHYVGHSYFDDATGKGYLLFPGPFVKELDIEIFSVWLSRTRFLYLSGCRSSEAGFVFELARLQLPGVLGFRWPIDDDMAIEFASQFYRNLFQTKDSNCLERAFLATRRAMQANHKENKIWASAMLILQSAD